MLRTVQGGLETLNEDDRSRERSWAMFGAEEYEYAFD